MIERCLARVFGPRVWLVAPRRRAAVLFPGGWLSVRTRCLCLCDLGVQFAGVHPGQPAGQRHPKNHKNLIFRGHASCAQRARLPPRWAPLSDRTVSSACFRPARLDRCPPQAGCRAVFWGLAVCPTASGVCPKISNACPKASKAGLNASTACPKASKATNAHQARRGLLQRHHVTCPTVSNV